MKLIFAKSAECTTSGSGGLINPGGLPKTCADNNTWNHILTEVFIILGAIAFLMIVVAGLRYIMSQGEPDKVAESKRQMIYAFIGLIIAASAAAIVNFVLGQA